MRRILYILALGLVGSLASCKREKAEWDTDWQLPLVEDSLTLEQLVGDSILTVNSGFYELSIDRTVFSLKLSDIVEIPDTTVHHSYAINLNSFNVSPGFSFVNDVQEHEMAMGDVQLKAIKVKAGGIKLRVESPVPTKTIFTVQLPGVTKNGQTLTQTFEVPAGTLANPSAISDYVDLTDYSLDLRGENAQSYNRLQSVLQVKSDPDGPSVTITNQDSLRFSFTMDDITLSYVRGYFGSQTYSDTITQHIDALNSILSGTVDLDAASLGLTIENGLKVNGKIMLTTLQNTNYEGNTVGLTHPQIGTWVNVNAATGTGSTLQPSTTNLTFDGNNSNLEQYLENHGGENRVGFQMKINPWGNVSGGWDEIYDEHPLDVKLTGNLPLNIGLDNLILQDTFDFSLNQNFDVTHVESGIIWLKATNAFPMQGDVELYFLNNSGMVIAQLDADNSIASSVYGTLVNSILQKDSYVQIPCSESVVQQLNSASKVILKVRLNTPDVNTNMSTKVSIPEGAFMKFKLGAKIAVKHKV